MTGDTTATLKDRYSEFQSWRAERPFAGSVLLVLAGMIIGYVPLQMVGDITFTQGSFVFIGLIFGLLVSLSGVFVLLRPEHSTFFGVAGVVLSTFSIVGALGGLFVGTVLGTIGGVLCFAWRPPEARDSAGGTTNPSRLASFSGFFRRNLEVIVLLGLTSILLVYFLHPLVPTIALPGAQAQQQTWTLCDPSGFPTNVDLACQNPPVDTGLGGTAISFGNLVAEGLTRAQVTTDTSTETGLLMTDLTIANSTITNGFTARKNFDGPTGQYHLELSASSSTIGGPGGDYTLHITELYGQELTGTFLGIDITDNNILICEPRNYDTLQAANDLGASLDLTGVTLNAHYVNAQNWVLYDFDISIEPGTQTITRYVETDSGDQGTAFTGRGGGNPDTCPGTH